LLCVSVLAKAEWKKKVKEEKAEKRKEKMPKHKKKFATKSHKAKITGK
jgi:hypothetical protein